MDVTSAKNLFKQSDFWRDTFVWINCDRCRLKKNVTVYLRREELKEDSPIQTHNWWYRCPVCRAVRKFDQAKINYVDPPQFNTKEKISVKYGLIVT